MGNVLIIPHPGNNGPYLKVQVKLDNNETIIEKCEFQQTGNEGNIRKKAPVIGTGIIDMESIDSWIAGLSDKSKDIFIKFLLENI